MNDNNVRHIAPFINDRFLITSKWWNYRDDPLDPGHLRLHRGLDIATSGKKPVYSILTGVVHSVGYEGIHTGGGNWIVIKDDNPLSPSYGYATLYLHLDQTPLYNVGDRVFAGQQVGIEGTTGSSTGVHLHVEMQDLNRWGNVWHTSNIKEDYIDPTEFMGIDNIQGTWWIYDGTPIPPTPSGKYYKGKFKWVLYARRLRLKRT